MRPVRVAVVGHGFMGRTHLAAIAKLSGIEAANVHLSDLAGAIADPRIDAVDLCIPTDLHASAAIEALRAGKHVLVEKPMALDLASCERMIQAAERAGRVLMVAHVLRFLPAYARLENAGKVRDAFFRRRCGLPDWAPWLHDVARSGGGPFDLLIHDVDIALHLFGEPCAIASTGRGGMLSARLFYADFCAEITGGWYRPGGPFWMEYTVETESATLDFDSRAAEPFDGYAAEIAYFAQCVRESKPPARCLPRESARAVRLMLALMAARERNGEKIPWKSE